MMTYTERARALRPYIEKASANLTDEDALQAVELFPQWVTGHAYVVDERLQHNGVLYRVVQAHTSQADWTPDITFHWTNGRILYSRPGRTMRTRMVTRSPSTASITSA